MTKIKEKNPIERKIHKAFHEIAKKRKVNVDKVSEIIDDWEKTKITEKVEISLNSIIIPESKFVLDVKTKKDFMKLVGRDWFFSTKKDKHKSYYFFSEVASFIHNEKKQIR